MEQAIYGSAATGTRFLPTPPRQAEVEALGERIAELAAQISAATYELLVMLREFDERGGWGCGFRTCAHWLNWRTGLELGAAREKVRVARALAALPRLSDSMRRGELSYSKVRALTRIATPANEEELLVFARAGTALHVEKLVRACRRVDRLAEAVEEQRRHEGRHLRTWTDEDGMVVVQARLAPEAGAALLKALDAAGQKLYDAAKNGRDAAGETSAAQRQADALGLVAESALAGGLDPGTRGDRYQVVLHVDAEALGDGGRRGTAAGAVLNVSAETSRCGGVSSRAAGRVSAETSRGEAAAALAVVATSATAPSSSGASVSASHTPTDVSAETLREPAGPTTLEGIHVAAETCRRVACDCAVVLMRHDGDGNALDVGRRTRTISPALRRALDRRDGGCRFPGCGLRLCDAHHVEHWADGGATRLDNLLQLCRFHHRAVHEGGCRVELLPDGSARFFRPDGRLVERAPALPVVARPAVALLAGRLAAKGVAPTAAETVPSWDGRPIEYDVSVQWLRSLGPLGPVES